IERVLECTDECVHFRLIGLTAAGRRHQTAAHFPYSLFPDLRVLADIIKRHSGEGDSSSARGSAVAGDAIRVQHRLDWTTRRRSGLSLRSRMRCEHSQGKKDEGQALHGAK